MESELNPEVQRPVGNLQGVTRLRHSRHNMRCVCGCGRCGAAKLTPPATEDLRQRSISVQSIHPSTPTVPSPFLSCHHLHRIRNPTSLRQFYLTRIKRTWRKKCSRPIRTVRDLPDLKNYSPTADILRVLDTEILDQQLPDILDLAKVILDGLLDVGYRTRSSRVDYRQAKMPSQPPSKSSWLWKSRLDRLLRQLSSPFYATVADSYPLL